MKKIDGRGPERSDASGLYQVRADSGIHGRVPVVVSLDALDEDALVRILQEPKNSLVKQYKALMDMDGVDLEFEPDALREVAKTAMERKTGARGLRSVIEKTMMDVMYGSPVQ